MSVANMIDVTNEVACWEPTLQLRWLVPDTTHTGPRKLQQRWVERFSGETQWRTVETEVMPFREFYGT